LPICETNRIGTVNALRVDLYGAAATSETPPRLAPLGFEDRQFKLSLAGTPGHHYQIQTSANLQAWADLMGTNLPSAGTIEILDPHPTGLPQRFNRAFMRP